ncbi:MAG: NAD-dependent epimerase/dehydratase family protein [Nitrososphaerales archaeon]
MNYFVIGGAGFIGSHLVDSLLKDKSAKVTIYDNLSSGKYEFVKHHKSNPNFRFIKGDILNIKKLMAVIKNHDFVFHLAANPDIRLGMKKTRLDFEINTIGTLNVLDAMVKFKIKKLAFTSTSTVFGEPSSFPTSEAYGPSLPVSLYGASKLACEGFITAYSTMFGIKSWIFRLANIIGDRSTHGIIFDFMKKIRKNPKELEVLGDGNQSKSYLTVGMLVEAMLHVIDHSDVRDSGITLLNVSNEDRLSVKRIVEIFLEERKLAPKVVFTGGHGGWKGDVPVMHLSIEKIKEYGWKPRMGSEECMRETIRNLPK